MQILVYVILFLLFSGLKSINILQGVFAHPVFIFSITLVGGYLLNRAEGICRANFEKQEFHYENLDFMRYLCALIIVIMHLRPYLNEIDMLDLLFNNIISRICVPFFFIVSGYFVARKSKEQSDYLRKYIKGMIPCYIFWSIVYIPLGLSYIQELGIPVVLFPVALLIGFLYFGTYYHLWYFPALFLSLILVRFWCKRFSIKSLLLVAFVLLCLGASETYYGMLPEGIQHFFTTYYFNIFYTTRNFLFFGLFYVALGYFLGSRKRKYVAYSGLLFVLSSVLLVIEVLVLQGFERLDSNIMFACIPMVYSMFHFLVYFKEVCPLRFRYSYRDLSKYYYFIHPLLIFIFLGLSSLYGSIEHGHLRALIIIVLVHFSANGLILLKRKFPKLPIG